jgi:hypothetical protein
MLAMGADHVAVAASGEAVLLIAIPALWIIGVVIFVALKFHSR